MGRAEVLGLTPRNLVNLDILSRTVLTVMIDHSLETNGNTNFVHCKMKLFIRKKAMGLLHTFSMLMSFLYPDIG